MIQFFTSDGQTIGVSASASVLLMNIQDWFEYSGLISFGINWLDLLAVQGTLKSLLQHRSSKVSILQHSVLFMVQLSHPYVTTGKTIALTRRTFVGKAMSLLFNMLSAKSLQLCPTLCDRIDGSLPGSFLRPWDFPSKSTGVGCHCLLQPRQLIKRQRHYFANKCSSS